MAKKFDFDDLENDLKSAHEESKSRKEGSGKYGSIFKDDLEVPKWRCKNGEHLIDIIPYRAGAYDPNRPEGKGAYFLDLYVHRNVGLNSDSYVCPSRNYKKPCPICEEIKRLSDNDVPYEDYKDDVPKRVNIYNIVCYDNDDEIEKGVQVWEVANFFMEDKLRGLAKNKRTGEPIYYASPKKETGRSIAFERKGKGRGNVEFLSHEFLKRDYDISIDILEQAVTLDECIHIPTYEEMYEAYYSKEYVKENVEEEYDKKRKTSSSRKRKTESEEDDVPDFKPPKRTRRRDYDDEDDDEKEEQPLRKTKKSSKLECPARGGTFGVDCDALPKCKTCEIWDDCAKEHDDLEAKASSRKQKHDDDEDDE